MADYLARAKYLPDIGGYIAAGLLPADAQPLAGIVVRHAAVTADVQMVRDTISDLIDEQRAAEQRDAAASKAAAVAGDPLPPLESEDVERRIKALRAALADFRQPIGWCVSEAIGAAKASADACGEHLDRVEAERRAVVAERLAAVRSAEAAVEEVARLRVWLAQAADIDYWQHSVPTARGLRTVRPPDNTPPASDKTTRRATAAA